MWLAAIEWLLMSKGITVESRRIAGEVAVWQGTSATGKMMIAALPPRERWTLDEHAIRQTAAHLAVEQTATVRMILSTAPATVAAIQTAERLGIQLIDRHVLQSLLSSLASAQDRERESQRDETQARAIAAVAARQAMLDTIDALERSLTPLATSQESRRSSARWSHC